MMCDVMPTISEDSISQRSSQLSGEDANFEQLMVSMLDERDKLVESLRETQERLGDSELRLKEVEKERDSLHRQIAANLPQVSNTWLFNVIYALSPRYLIFGLPNNLVIAKIFFKNLWFVRQLIIALQLKLKYPNCVFNILNKILSNFQIPILVTYPVILDVLPWLLNSQLTYHKHKRQETSEKEKKLF